MLERVLNINSGFGLRENQNRPTGFDKYFQTSVETHSAIHDSINISPAAVLLQKIKWKLLQLKTVSKDKIAVRFACDEIEFLTEIDMNLNLHFWRQVFNAYDYFVFDRKKIKCSLQYSISPNQQIDKNEFELMELRSLKQFFEKAVTDSSHHELPFSAIPEIGWYEGSQARLEYELINVFHGVILLVDKLYPGQLHISGNSAEVKPLQMERFVATEI